MWLESMIDFYTAQLPMIAISFPVLLAPFVWLERRRPVATPPSWRDYGKNFGIFISTQAIAAPTAISAAHASAAIRAVAPWPTLDFTFADIGVGLPILDAVLRVLAMIFLPLLLHDVWFYWSHRLEHKLPWLWRFHRLHHSDPNMNASTYARDHFLQTVWRSLFAAFTLGLFVDIELRQAEQAALLSSLFLGLWSQFYHSAARIRLPWLHYILVTPQVHRIHHSLSPRHHDKNFADVFPVFDLLFGTFYRPQAEEFPATGLADQVAPANWWEAQCEPLRRVPRASPEITG